jgi:O-acetyl-ADP-ribose deacetylase (regulator of RNase III)
MQTVVNTVNCVGVMGAGIALDFRLRYPTMFEKYKAFCDRGEIRPGILWNWPIPNSEKMVLNFPTKDHFKYPSKESYLVDGLEKFLSSYKEKGITSIAFPLLGAQNGKLDPMKVRELMVDYLSEVDIPVEIYEYDPKAEDDLLPLLREELVSGNLKMLQKQSGLSKKTLENLQTALEVDYLKSLVQLKKVKGIGEKTLQDAYTYAMKLKAANEGSGIAASPQELFAPAAKPKALPKAEKSEIKNIEPSKNHTREVLLDFVKALPLEALPSEKQAQLETQIAEWKAHFTNSPANTDKLFSTIEFVVSQFLSKSS